MDMFVCIEFLSWVVVLFSLIHAEEQEWLPGLARNLSNPGTSCSFYLIFRSAFYSGIRATKPSLCRKINILLAWSLSDLWNGFFPKPGRELSALTEGEELEVEF